MQLDNYVCKLKESYSRLSFADEITQGIPKELPSIPAEYSTTVNHAPQRPQVLSTREERLALANALRYSPRGTT